MHRAAPPRVKLDITQRSIPPPDPRYANAAAVVNSGLSSLQAPPAQSASSVSRARSELFSRIKARALLSLLSNAGAIAEEPSVDDGGASELIGGLGSGETRIVRVDAADVGCASSPGTRARARSAETDARTDVLLLDARGAELADLFTAVRIAGALHCPATEYTIKDRLPAAVHAARRAALQPAIVVYDEGTDADAALLATKLVSVAGFNAVFVLSGGLRAAAAATPRLLEGDHAHAFIAGVNAEQDKSPRSARRVATARAGAGAGAPLGESRGGQSGGSVGGESRGGSVASRASGASRSTFGGSRRF